MTSLFLKSGLGYSLVTLIVAAFNLVFWFIAVKLTNASEIGLSSSIYSIPMLFSSIALLSIEYPLLKTISKEKSYFGSSIIYALIIHIIFIPILMISIQKITDNYLLMIFSIIIMFTSFFNAVSYYSLVGSFSIKSVIITEIIGVSIKIGLLILFLKFQLGAVGILMAIICQLFVLAITFSVLSIKKFDFRFKMQSLKTILLEGISNFPIKLSKILQYFGSISILALYGIPQEEIASFTISYGILVFVSIIPYSLSLIAIPSSTKEGQDIVWVSSRIGMAFTSPLISVLTTSPALILSVYGNAYSKHYELLSILAISLIPFILTTNVITTLNNSRQYKRLAIIGIVESIIFLSVIAVLVPRIGVIAGAWAITIASVGSGCLSFFWASKMIKKYFLICIFSIAMGYGSTIALQQVIQIQYITAFVALSITSILLFVLKLINVKEISFIIRQIRK